MQFFIMHFLCHAERSEASDREWLKIGNVPNLRCLIAFDMTKYVERSEASDREWRKRGIVPNLRCLITFEMTKYAERK